MDAVITLVAATGQTIEASALSALNDAGITTAPKWLKPGQAADFHFELDPKEAHVLRQRLDEALKNEPIDFALQDAKLRRKKLFLADMDSTLIAEECLDELGRAAGVGAEIIAITERAMRGEVDFAEAMAARVILLKGMAEEQLADVYENQITINPGARTLVRTMRANGVLTRLISGGFTFFASRVAEAIGFERFTANKLEIIDGELTGLVHEPLLAEQSKIDALTESCAALGIGVEKALAVGDGANDVGMIKAAGLGVAYRAKPILIAASDATLGHADLSALLYFQGYEASDFITD